MFDVSIQDFIDATIELQNIIYSLEDEGQVQLIAEEIANSNFMKFDYQFKVSCLIIDIFKAYESRFKMQNAYPKLVIAISEIYPNHILKIKRSVFKMGDRVFEKDSNSAVDNEMSNIDASLSFIRRLFDLGFIQKEELMCRVNHIIKINTDKYIVLHTIFWFGNELKEYDITRFEDIKSDCRRAKRQSYFVVHFDFKFDIAFSGKAHEHYYQLPESLEKVIYDDNLKEFEQIFSSHDFNVNQTIELFDFFPFSPGHSWRKTSERPINIAAYYGSIKIFKFLFIQPDIQIDDELLDDSASGGNIEIVRLVEQKIGSIKNVLNAKFHHNDIYHWLRDIKGVTLNSDLLAFNNNIELFATQKDYLLYCCMGICILSNSFACAIQLFKTSRFEFSLDFFRRKLKFIIRCDMANFVKLAVDNYKQKLSNLFVLSIRSSARDCFDYLLSLPSLNINCANDKGITPLYESVINPDVYFTVRLLNSRKINITKECRIGCPVSLAFQSRNIAVIDAFLKNDKTRKQLSNFFEIIFLISTFDSALFDDFDCLSHINEFDSDGLFLAHHAASGGSISNLKKIINKDRYMAQIAGLRCKSTPLMIAVKSCQVSAAIFLLNLKDIDIDINAQDINKSTALHYAASCGLDDVVMELLSHQDIDVYLLDKFKRTAFSLACRWCSNDVISCFFSIEGIEYNKIDANGNSPLFYALYYKGLCVLDYFPKNSKIVFSKDYLEAFLKTKDEDLIKLLFDLMGEKQIAEYLNVILTVNSTFLDYIITKYPNILEKSNINAFLNHDTSYKTFESFAMSDKVDINTVDERKKSIVMWLIDYQYFNNRNRGSYRLLEHMIKKGIDYKLHDITGDFVIHYMIIRYVPIAMISLAIEHGADINAQNTVTLETPLHLAISCRYVKFVRFVIALKEFDPSLKNRDGQNALEYSRITGNDDIHQILEDSYFF